MKLIKDADEVKLTLEKMNNETKKIFVDQLKQIKNKLESERLKERLRHEKLAKVVVIDA